MAITKQDNIIKKFISKNKKIRYCISWVLKEHYLMNVKILIHRLPTPPSASPNITHRTVSSAQQPPVFHHVAYKNSICEKLMESYNKMLMESGVRSRGHNSFKAANQKKLYRTLIYLNFLSHGGWRPGCWRARGRSGGRGR